jgi:hypothetical protein
VKFENCKNRPQPSDENMAIRNATPPPRQKRRTKQPFTNLDPEKIEYRAFYAERNFVMSEHPLADAVKSEIDLIDRMLETKEYIAVSPICLSTFDDGDDLNDCRYCPIWQGPSKSENCKKFIPANQSMTFAQFYDYVQNCSDALDEKSRSWLIEFQSFLKTKYEELVAEGR